MTEMTVCDPSTTALLLGERTANRGRLSESKCRASRSRNRAPRARAVMEGARLCGSRCGGRTCAFRFRRISTSASRGRASSPRAAREVSAGGPHLGRGAADASGHVGLVSCGAWQATRTRPQIHHVRSKLTAHDMLVFHMSNGAIVTFNDPRRFGYMKLVCAHRPEPGSDDRRTRPRTARQCVRWRNACRCLRRQENEPEGRTVGPEGRGGSRQHLCVRGAAPRASISQAPRLDHRDQRRGAD